MKKYLLDSNICIELLRGNNKVKSKSLDIGMKNCCISFITMLELKIGETLAKAKAPAGRFVDQHVDDFIDNLEIIPVESAADLFVKEKVRLQLAGTPAHNNFDLLIGCTAVANHFIMVTDNIKDFKRIKGIKIENWIER